MLIKLCRTVTLTKDHKLVHTVCPLDDGTLESVKIIAGPTKLSFDSFHLAALIENADVLGPDFLFDEDILVSWSILVTDHLEQKPLFSNMSGARALLLVGEIIHCLFEGFHSFNSRLLSVTPIMENNHLLLTFTVDKGSFAHASLGNALCLATMIDALLFVRGLQVSFSTVSLLGDTRGRPDFIELYRFVLTECHGY